MTSEAYFFYSGIVLNALVLLTFAIIFWRWFIWPAFIATSLVRCFTAYQIKYGHERKLSRTLRQWWIEYTGHLIVGQTYDSICNRHFAWHGVGRWTVFNGEDNG
ncbi:TPA: hypothetical protein PXM42_004157 [Yersinia enterocolitica]|uniref:hypothetical protein n=1 Tax=Yersinia enterocolitica TaxID=630 RepID=UPI00330F10F2|nr:hypothetical protein [Yersinia enterocolitica]